MVSLLSLITIPFFSFISANAFNGAGFSGIGGANISIGTSGTITGASLAAITGGANSLADFSTVTGGNALSKEKSTLATVCSGLNDTVCLLFS